MDDPGSRGQRPSQALLESLRDWLTKLARGTVLATYGTQRPSLAALDAALWGEASVTGLLPVTLGQSPAEPRSTN